MPFHKILLKDIRETLFDRDVIVLLLLGPIFLTLLFGGVYLSDYLKDIPVAVLDEDNSSMSRMIVQQFSDSDRFNLSYRADSRDGLRELLDARKVHMGVYIPPDFSKKVTNLESSEVLILANGTNIVVANNAYAQAANIIQTIGVGTQIKLIEGKGVVPSISQDVAMPFKFTDRTLYDPKLTYMNYLILGFVAVFFQQIMLSGIGISVTKKLKEIAEDHTIKRILSKILTAAFYGLPSTFVAIYITAQVFKVPIRGSLSLALFLAIIFVFAISGPAIIIAVLVKNKLKFAQIAFMLSLPTFASCGYLWTTDQLPQALVIGIKMIWPLIYFARLFDEILIKGLVFNTVKGDLLQLGLYALVWLPLAILLFKKQIHRKQEVKLSQNS